MSVNASDQRRMWSTGETVVMVAALDDAESVLQRQIRRVRSSSGDRSSRPTLIAHRSMQTIVPAHDPASLVRAMTGDSQSSDFARRGHVDDTAIDRPRTARAKCATRYRVER